MLYDQSLTTNDILPYMALFGKKFFDFSEIFLEGCGYPQPPWINSAYDIIFHKYHPEPEALRVFPSLRCHLLSAQVFFLHSVWW